MRSNGVGHVANDTFIAVTRDETENIFLVTSRLVDERVTPFPLTRQVRFVPFGDIFFVDGDNLTHSFEGTGEIKSDILVDDYQQTDLHDVRHSFHTAVDGKLLAVISTGRSRHYLIDLQNFSVCEFTTNGIVVSVAWHPTNTTRLMLLLNTGTLLLIVANTSRLGVTFDDRREVQLDATVAKVRDYILGMDSTNFSFKMSSKFEALEYKKKNLLMLPASKTTNLEGTASMSFLSLSPESSVAGEDGKKSFHSIEETRYETQANNLSDAVITAAFPDMALADWKSGFIDASMDNREGSLIGLCIVPPSRTLSAMLLVLSVQGDVFSVKIDDDGMPTSLSKEYDGRVDVTMDKDYLQHCMLGSLPSVHYLVRGSCTGDTSGEYPLAIGTTLLDEDVGYHAVFVLYSSGILRGNWFCEPDLLCRNHMRQNMDFTIHLDSVLPPFPLTPHLPSVAHLVTLQTCGNATLLRYAGSAYLCVWPTWSRRGGCWVHRREETEGCQRVPVAGHGAEWPEPVVARLPYDLSGASVGIGVNDILIFPEALDRNHSAKGHKCARSKVIVTKIANLILSALYARGEKYILTFNTNNDHSNENITTDSSAYEKDDKDVAECDRNSLKDYSLLEQLLELTAKCHRRWLCSYSHDTMNNITNELTDAVENANVKLSARWSALQDREERLSLRARRLLQREEQLTKTIADSQTVIRDAIAHRCGRNMLETANEFLGKTHKLLNELEALAAERKIRKDEKLLIDAPGIDAGEKEN